MAAADDVDGAAALLRLTRARFERLEEPSEVRATDLVLAEVLLEAGRLQEAGESLDLVLDGAGTEPPLSPAVHRLIGRHHASQGRFDEARLMLLAGVELATSETNRFEEGLLRLEIAALDRREGRPDDGNESRAREILDAMGVLVSRR